MRCGPRVRRARTARRIPRPDTTTVAKTDRRPVDLVDAFPSVRTRACKRGGSDARSIPVPHDGWLPMRVLAAGLKRDGPGTAAVTGPAIDSSGCMTSWKRYPEILNAGSVLDFVEPLCEGSGEVERVERFRTRVFCVSTCHGQLVICVVLAPLS